MKCQQCDADLVSVLPGEWSTLVGYDSPPGHNHNDNCKSREFKCANGHANSIYRRNRCPLCDWAGKKSCFCHNVSDDVEEYPIVPEVKR